MIRRFYPKSPPVKRGEIIYVEVTSAGQLIGSVTKS
jgi:hypothetical protein